MENTANNTATASPLEQLSVPTVPTAPIPPSPFVNLDPNTPVSLKVPVSAFARRPVSATEAPGVAPRARNGVQYLAGMLDDPAKQSYIIEVQRVGPPVWEGVQLPCGPIERCIPMAYPELYRRVKESHGGGEYRIRVLDENGNMTYQFPFTIDTLIDAPKFKQVNLNGMMPQVGRPTISGAPVPSLFGATGIASAEQELQEIRTKERVEIAEHQLMRVKRERQKTERQIQEEERLEREREERMKMAPAIAAENALREELRSLKEALSSKGDDKFMTLLMQMNKDSREAAERQAQRDREAADRQLQMMQQQAQEAQRRSDEMMKMFMTLMEKGNSKTSDQLEIARIQAQSQKDMLDMTLKQAQGGGSRIEKLMETVVMNKLTQPENQMEQALNLMERGRKQTLEMLELREKFGPSSGDEETWNPEAGVLGNLGRMMFGFLSDAVKSGGVGLIGQWIQSQLNKPAAQATPHDLTRLAYGVEHNQIAPPLLQMGVPAAPTNFSGSQPAIPVLPYRPVQPVQQPPQQVQQRHVIPPTPAPALATPKPVQVQQEHAPIEILELAPAAAPVRAAVQPQQVQPQPVGTNVNDEALERLHGFVTEAMEIACGDLEDGRAEPEWVEFALAKWPRHFLDSLLVVPTGDAGRIEAIRQYTEAEVFNRLMQLVATPVHYQHFMQALMSMMGEYRNRKIVPISAAS